MMELDELLDVEHLRMVARGARVQPGDHGTDVAKDCGIHQGERKKWDKLSAGEAILYLKVFLQPLLERVRDLVELVELAHPLHGRVVSGGARVQPLNDCAHVAKDARVHQSCREHDISVPALSTESSLVVC